MLRINDNDMMNDNVNSMLINLKNLIFFILSEFLNYCHELNPWKIHEH